MGFTVSARKSGRDLAHRQPSLLGAIDLTLSMSLSGMSDIRVIADGGRTYTEADIGELLRRSCGEEEGTSRDALSGRQCPAP